MHRYAKTLTIVLLSLVAGACAGKVRQVLVPTSPTPESVVTDPEAPLNEPEDIEVLTVRSLDADELTVPSELKRLDPACDVAAKVRETATDPDLAAFPIKAGTKLHSYAEVRFEALDMRADYELDIGVRVLDLDTCTTQVIGIKKRYSTGPVRVPVKTTRGTLWTEKKLPVAVVEAPDGWTMEVVRRAQGVEWNTWGTEFRITPPPRSAVVGVKWPHVPDNPGNGPRVVPVTYVPYSRELHLATLITGGRDYLHDDLIAGAYADLREARVESSAFPGTLVADVAAIDPEMLAGLAAIEHMDPLEFGLDPSWSTDRIFVIIGANRERTAAYTCSGAAACGIMQFTDDGGPDPKKKGHRLPGTYTTIRTRYSAAKLMPSFVEGARDHHNAMKAAILLLDNNLAYFKSVLTDTQFQRVLADRDLRRDLQYAAYNTGASRTMNVYMLALAKKMTEWTEARGSCRKPTYTHCLLTETKGYVVKGRYIDGSWLPEFLAVDR